MAHEISTASGRAEMFYVGSTPWHGLGTQVEGSATSEVALKAAGLDWTVRLEDIKTSSGLKVPMGKAVIREDVNSCLGMVGRRWKPVQNREAFGFLDGLAGAALEYETAGALGAGERVWMMAKLPQELRVKGTEDVTKPYLLLSNMHDGFGSLRCYFTGVRVVCANTLAMSTRDFYRKGVAIRHTGDLDSKMAEAAGILGLATKFFEEAQVSIDALAATKVTKQMAVDYFTTIFPDPAKPEEAKVALRNAEETRSEVFRLFDDGAGAKEKKTRHTMWTAYNAVTEYVDHVHKNKAKQLDHDAKESHLTSIWFGAGATLKAKAWDAAMATVGTRS